MTGRSISSSSAPKPKEETTLSMCRTSDSTAMIPQVINSLPNPSIRHPRRAEPSGPPRPHLFETRQQCARSRSSNNRSLRHHLGSWKYKCLALLALFSLAYTTRTPIRALQAVTPPAENKPMMPRKCWPKYHPGTAQNHRCALAWTWTNTNQRSGLQ